MIVDFLNKFFVYKKDKIKFTIGQKVLCKHNGAVCSIKREIDINNIKHYEICIENDVTRREIILSEYALKTNYKCE